jgi:hypothetical protein
MTWIDLSEAARRSGLTTRHLRRLCSTRWQPKNLARPSSCGWQVDESADARFLTFENEIDSAVDLRNVCEQDRKTTFYRLSILHRWRTFLQTHSQNNLNRNALTQQFLSEVLENKLSRGTLYRWEKLYHAQGIAGLLPTHSSEKLSLSSEAVNAFREIYLSPELSLFKIPSFFNSKDLCKMIYIGFVTEFLWQRDLYARSSCYDLVHSRTDLTSGNITGRESGFASTTFGMSTKYKTPQAFFV